MKAKARPVGILVLLLAAIGVFVMLKPAAPPDYAAMIASAKADYATNNATASGAPQQAVVNGWIARDLLEVMASENATSSSDPRVPALALIGVLAVLLIAASPTPAPAAAVAAAEDGAVPVPVAA